MNPLDGRQAQYYVELFGIDRILGYVFDVVLASERDSLADPISVVGLVWDVRWCMVCGHLVTKGAELLVFQELRLTEERELVGFG